MSKYLLRDRPQKAVPQNAGSFSSPLILKKWNITDAVGTVHQVDGYIADADGVNIVIDTTKIQAADGSFIILT